MLKFLDDLDKKNKLLNNLALMPGFNIIDSKIQNDLLDNVIQNDKDLIDDKMFSKFYGCIDNSSKNTNKNSNKNTRKKREKTHKKKSRKI